MTGHARNDERSKQQTSLPFRAEGVPEATAENRPQEQPSHTNARRTPKDLEALASRVAAFVADHPALAIGEISKGMGIAKRELLIPIRKLIHDEVLRLSGSGSTATYQISPEHQRDIKTPPPPSDWLTAKEVAKVLGLKLSSVYSLRQELQPTVHKNGEVRYSRALVEQARAARAARMADVSLTSRQWSLATRIRGALEYNFLDTAGLAKALQESREAVEHELQVMREEGKVVNVGSDDFPSWFLRPGPEVSHQELMATIVRLISHHPLPAVSIEHATGASKDKVRNALIDIRRARTPDKKPVHNIFDTNPNGTAIYFIVPPNAQTATLEPRWANYVRASERKLPEDKK